MTITDRRGQAVLDTGMFPPARAATTGTNIVLAGLQTIDGVVLVGADRVLVKDQTDPTLNGLYNASTGNWTRTTDASGNQDFFQGMGVTVALGTLNGGATFLCTSSDNPVIIGTSAITWKAQTGGVVVAQASSVSPSGGRLTLASGVPVTTSDITATTIFFTPAVGNQILIWNNSVFVPVTFAELSLALDSNNAHSGYHQAGKLFDCFVSNALGVFLGTGPAWSTSTSRGAGAGTTELQFLNGVWVNKNQITLRYGAATGNTVVVPANQARYVGTFAASADGTTKDAVGNRLLFNAYNQAPRPLFVTDPVNTTAANSNASWAYFNSNSANNVGVVIGLDGVEVSARATMFYASSTSGGAQAYTGIGLDGALINLARSTFQICTNSITAPALAFYEGFPGLGKHTLDWLWYGSASPSVLGFGTNSGAVPYTPGLTGMMWS